ncbi:11744_t:CDS:2 [Gigaspora margarita]|uniref:11744_t:CDS:1 n=1 Tax=Gigaspora margarita TaxID=4874 RepID=A0ABN7UQ63_GIGMA|nr:11744_t:CDS:2 [Gigaspora margarita]
MSYNVGDKIKLSEAFQFHRERKYDNAWKNFSELKEKSKHIAYDAKFMMVYYLLFEHRKEQDNYHLIIWDNNNFAKDIKEKSKPFYKNDVITILVYKSSLENKVIDALEDLIKQYS